ncbi:MAG: hypothetical protein HYX56_00980 [Chloroflexi bacterium]|nr:hypothetical protein [Chloroflexota bacterium]
MRTASFVTTVGTIGTSTDGRDVVITHEPETGATLRTRGRFYLVCEIDPPSRGASEIAGEIAEIVRHEYYYDLSAGVEVGLRRALRKANRRAAQLIREQRGRLHLHLACAVVVNNEVYAARIGSAQVFLVRHARLFLPGDEPGELADFVHRTTTREAASVGAETDLLPEVWRQIVEAGDTIVLAAGSLVETIGAEALKNAAITLHPRAAARHVRDRAVAEGITGSTASVFIEVVPAAGAAARLGGGPDVSPPPAEVVIAESIRSRADTVVRVLPRPGRMLAAITRPLTALLTRVVGVGLELMPRKHAALPRRPESARLRTRRAQRLTSLLAVLLLLVVGGIGYAVVRDYEANQVVNDYRLAVIDVETDMASARSFASRNDTDRAWQKVDAARQRLAVAASFPGADATRLAQLRDEIAGIEDKLSGVIIDLSKVASGAAPVDLTQTVNGLYAADPGAGRLWRIFGDPLQTGVVLQRGGGLAIGTPVAVTSVDAALLTLDDARKLWKAEGNTVKEVAIPKTDTWKSATDLATFAGNVYVLDGASGQLWRYEEDFSGKLAGPVAFLPQPLTADSARGLAVDGDIWILAGGELQRYRRQGTDRVLTRLPLTIQWIGTPLRPTHIQALESQRSLWLVDAPARILVQVTRDGREVARFALPERLAPPTAFFVSEGQRLAYTVHGAKVSTTDLTR